MPQLNKGGKYIFGLSEIRHDFTVQFPKQAITEYDITRGDGAVILFTGSKSTGGFCVTSKRLLEHSKLQHILSACPDISAYAAPPCKFIPFKGRAYCWVPVSLEGVIQLTSTAMDDLKLNAGDTLLSIRSSNIAFTMGAKGVLLERARSYNGVIEHF